MASWRTSNFWSAFHNLRGQQHNSILTESGYTGWRHHWQGPLHRLTTTAHFTFPAAKRLNTFTIHNACCDNSTLTTVSAKIPIPTSSSLHCYTPFGSEAKPCTCQIAFFLHQKQHFICDEYSTVMFGIVYKLLTNVLYIQYIQYMQCSML